MNREIAKREEAQESGKVKRLTGEPKGYDRLKRLRNDGTGVILRDIGDVLALRKKRKLEKDKILIEKMRSQHLDVVKMSTDILASNSFLVNQDRNMLHLTQIYKETTSKMTDKSAERAIAYPTFEAWYDHEEVKEQRYPLVKDGLPE